MHHKPRFAAALLAVLLLAGCAGHAAASTAPVEMRVQDGYIQYRSGGDWQTLMAVDELKGEKGDKGDPGPAGPAGPQGEKGEKGDTGAQGPAGPKGDPGAQGAQGIQGVQGEQGSQGEKGDKGDKGDTGAAGTSPAPTPRPTPVPTPEPLPQLPFSIGLSESPYYYNMKLAPNGQFYTPGQTVTATVELGSEPASGYEPIETVFWRSTDPDVAAIDQDGIITCKSFGTTQIIAMINGRFSKSVNIAVAEHAHKFTVEKNKPATCLDPYGIRLYICECGFVYQENYYTGMSNYDFDPECHLHIDPETGICGDCGRKIYTGSPTPAPVPEPVPTPMPTQVPEPTPAQPPEPTPAPDTGSGEADPTPSPTPVPVPSAPPEPTPPPPSASDS